MHPEITLPSSFDIGIGFKYPKLIYLKSFEMNRQQIYTREPIFLCWLDERYICMW